MTTLQNKFLGLVALILIVPAFATLSIYEPQTLQDDESSISVEQNKILTYVFNYGNVEYYNMNPELIKIRNLVKNADIENAIFDNKKDVQIVSELVFIDKQRIFRDLGIPQTVIMKQLHPLLPKEELKVASLIVHKEYINKKDISQIQSYKDIRSYVVTLHNKKIVAIVSSKL